MAEQSLWTVAGWILLLIFLVLIIWAVLSPEGFINAVAEASFGVEKFLPVKPQPDLKKLAPVPEKVGGARDSITSSLVSLPQKSGSRCVTPLQSVDDLKEYTIEVTQQKDRATFTILKKEGKGFVRHSSTSLEGIKVCTVKPEIFYGCHLSPTYDCPLDPSSRYEVKTSLTLSSDSIMPYLYKVDEKTICFIPRGSFSTFAPCIADKGGVSDKCLPKIKNINSCV